MRRQIYASIVLVVMALSWVNGAWAQDSTRSLKSFFAGTSNWNGGGSLVVGREIGKKFSLTFGAVLQEGPDQFSVGFLTPPISDMGKLFISAGFPFDAPDYVDWRHPTISALYVPPSVTWGKRKRSGVSCPFGLQWKDSELRYAILFAYFYKF